MSVPPESIHVGQCYLMASGQVKRVLAILAAGRVHYEYRITGRPIVKNWKPGTQELRTFAALVARPVPYDWTPETDAVGEGGRPWE